MQARATAIDPSTDSATSRVHTACPTVPSTLTHPTATAHNDPKAARRNDVTMDCGHSAFSLTHSMFRPMAGIAGVPKTANAKLADSSGGDAM